MTPDEHHELAEQLAASSIERVETAMKGAGSPVIHERPSQP